MQDRDFPTGCQVDAWSPRVPGVREVFHARMVGYSYPPHVHDTWAVLIVDRGAIRYDLDRRPRDTVSRSVALLPPGVAHDGRPAPGSAGFRKRELYLDRGFLPDGLIGKAVDRTSLRDPELRAALSGLHDCLAGQPGPELLDAQTRLAMIGARIREHLTPPFEPIPLDAIPEPGIAEQLRELLDAHLTDHVDLEWAAALLGRSSPHLIRSFKHRFGVSPYAYVVGRRIDLARRLLLEGAKPADVAVSVGFYDQAHLTRHFKKYTATTPAQFARSHALGR